MNEYNNKVAYEKAKKRVEREKGFYSHLTVYLIINIALLLINSDFFDEGFNNWLDWNLYTTPFLWGIGLLFHGLSVFTKIPVFGSKWEERKIEEFMNDDNF